MKKDIDNGLGAVEDLSKTGGRLGDDEDADDNDAGLVFGDEDEPIPSLLGEEDDEAGDDPDEEAGETDEEADGAGPDEGEDPPPEIKAEEEDPDAIDEDLQGYSSKVQKRVMRERRLKAKAVREAESLRKELSDARAALEEQRAKQAEADIDDRLQKAIDEFEDARRDADTRKEVEAQAKVTRLVEERNQIEERKQRRQPASEDAGGDHPAFAAWKAKNAWFDKPEHRAQRAAAVQLAQQIMADEGLSDTDERLYLKLSAKLPGVIKVPGAKEKPAPKRTTVARMPEGSDSGRRRVVQLDAETVAFMRRMQLDPSNKTHVSAFLKEKRNASR